MSENQASKVIEAKEIMTLLPHRYPFLLVDRVLDYKEGEWLKAIKNISVTNLALLVISRVNRFYLVC